MRTLVVFAHPSTESFGAALLDTALKALEKAGHELRVVDLYRDGFDPVLGPEAWRLYKDEPSRLIPSVQPYVDAMLWAESLVMIYPTWMYGPPSILKGWMERVWLPGVAFEIAEGTRQRAMGKLNNIKRFTVVTTSGSPWWWLRLIRDPGRSMMLRGFRVLFNIRCKTLWLQLHDMNHNTQSDRSAFLNKVGLRLAKIQVSQG